MDNNNHCFTRLDIEPRGNWMLQAVCYFCLTYLYVDCYVHANMPIYSFKSLSDIMLCTKYIKSNDKYDTQLFWYMS